MIYAKKRKHISRQKDKSIQRYSLNYFWPKRSERSFWSLPSSLVTLNPASYTEMICLCIINSIFRNFAHCGFLWSRFQRLECQSWKVWLLNLFFIRSFVGAHMWVSTPKDVPSRYYYQHSILCKNTLDPLILWLQKSRSSFIALSCSEHRSVKPLISGSIGWCSL